MHPWRYRNYYLGLYAFQTVPDGVGEGLVDLYNELQPLVDDVTERRRSPRVQEATAEREGTKRSPASYNHYLH